MVLSIGVSVLANAKKPLELIQRLFKTKSGWQDSNLRPSRLKSGRNGTINWCLGFNKRKKASGIDPKAF
jgi:hypothetical protein